jgi:hypothetical protein
MRQYNVKTLALLVMVPTVLSVSHGVQAGTTVCGPQSGTCWEGTPTGGNTDARRGTEVAAIFNTLLETAKLVGVDPAKYLREAVLADARGEVLLPGDLVN